MKDRKGNELAVGDRVYVLPEKHTRSGGSGYVRRLKDGKARVDDGPPNPQSQLEYDGSWTWSAWVKSEQVEKV